MNTTKTAQFTPGPWVYDGGSSIKSPSTDIEVVSLYGAMGGDNNKADAYMLSAAPAMYEALQQSLVLVELAALEEWGRAVRGEQQPPTTEAKDRLEKVKAALAQAEGRHHE